MAQCKAEDPSRLLDSAPDCDICMAEHKCLNNGNGRQAIGSNQASHTVTQTDTTVVGVEKIDLKKQKNKLKKSSDIFFAVC